MTNTTTIQIRLNGEARDVAHDTNIDALVRALGMRPELVAVELNEALVPRPARATTTLCQGDRLELVTLVGGG